MGVYEGALCRVFTALMMGPHSTSCDSSVISPAFVVFLDLMGTGDLYQRADVDALDGIADSYSRWSIDLARFARRGVPARFPTVSFSDMVYVTYPWCPNKKCTKRRLNWLFHLCGYAQYSAISRGFLVRGGVAKGSISVRANCISGAPVIQAYLNESKVAKYPRVVLSEESSQGIDSLPELFLREEGLIWPSFHEYLDRKDEMVNAMLYLERIRRHRPSEYVDYVLQELRT